MPLVNDSDAAPRPALAAATAIGSVCLPDGSRLAYAQAGVGPDVVLVHGTLTTMDDMVLALTDSLSPRFRVTAFDRPGHGASTRGRFEGRLTRQAARLREGMASLGLHRPILVGHSAGGATVLTLALTDPAALSGVVALAPVVFPELRLEQILYGPRAWPGAGDLLAGTAGPAMDALVNPVLWRAMFLPQAMPEDFRALFPFGLAGRPSQMQATGEDSNALAVDLALNLAQYPRCQVPTVVLGGDCDIVVNPLHGRMLASLLPRGRHLTLPGMGHMIHHFRQDAIRRAVEDLAVKSLAA